MERGCVGGGDPVEECGAAPRVRGEGTRRTSTPGQRTRGVSEMHCAPRAATATMAETTQNRLPPAYHSWLRKQGVAHAGVRFCAAPGRGTYGVAASDIGAGSVVLTVPKSAMLTVRNSPHADALESLLEMGMPPPEVLALALALERRAGAKSRWAPYVDSLPRDAPLPLLWSAAELRPSRARASTRRAAAAARAPRRQLPRGGGRVGRRRTAAARRRPPRVASCRAALRRRFGARRRAAAAHRRAEPQAGAGAGARRRGGRRRRQRGRRRRRRVAARLRDSHSARRGERRRRRRRGRRLRADRDAAPFACGRGALPHVRQLRQLRAARGLRLHAGRQPVRDGAAVLGARGGGGGGGARRPRRAAPAGGAARRGRRRGGPALCLRPPRHRAAGARRPAPAPRRRCEEPRRHPGNARSRRRWRATAAPWRARSGGGPTTATTRPRTRRGSSAASSRSGRRPPPAEGRSRAARPTPPRLLRRAGCASRGPVTVTSPRDRASLTISRFRQLFAAR